MCSFPRLLFQYGVSKRVSAVHRSDTECVVVMHACVFLLCLCVCTILQRGSEEPMQFCFDLHVWGWQDSELSEAAQRAATLQEQLHSVTNERDEAQRRLQVASQP